RPCRGTAHPEGALSVLEICFVAWSMAFSNTRHRELLGALCSIFRAALLTVGHTDGVERSPHNVITHARKVFDATAPHEHDRVLLQVMPYARNVSGDFHSVRQPHARNFSKRGVRFLRCRCIHTQTHSAFLG